MRALYQVIRIVCSERALKRAVYNWRTPRSWKRVLLCVLGAWSLCPVSAGLTDYPKVAIMKVQNTGPKVWAGRHGASEAWGLRIMRSQTWSVAIFSSVKWGSVINSRTRGSNVSETLGNSMLLGKEGVLVSMRTDADSSWGLEQESSASMEVGFSLEPSKRAPQVKVRKCPWFRLFSFKSLNFRMWLAHTENYYISSSLAGA